MDLGTFQILDQIKQKITDDDLTLKVVLKPLEIALKKFSASTSNSSWKDKQQAKIKIDDQQQKKQYKSKEQLANGLRIALKKSFIEENKFDLADFQDYSGSDQSENRFAELRKKNQDNLISFLKPKMDQKNVPILLQDRSSLAICVCMYNESKTKLRDTLKGIQQNLVNIVKSGVSCDDVSVIVVIDGIQTMNKGMVSYFEELQRQNDTFIEEEAYFDIFDIQSKVSKEEDYLDQNLDALNMNMVLFNEKQLEDRRSRAFKSIYQSYMEMKNLLASIQQMETNHPIFYSLPITVKNIFLRIARQVYNEALLRMQAPNTHKPFHSQNKKSPKKQKQLIQEVEEISDEQIINFSLNSMSRYSSILIKSLQQSKKHSQQYLTSRENLSYLASFRKKIKMNYQEMFEDQDEIQGRYQSSNQTFMNLFICVKYKNRGKLSSHDWFFNGFCKELYPKYTILLDVGLRPRHDALYKMYNYLRRDQEVGGVCGYMSLKLQKLQEEDEVRPDQVDCLTSFMMNFVDIQRAQQVQYHFAHLIDKAFESQFDFIHVLPGAFSAYNMTTLTQVNPNGYTLLKEYFKSIDQKIANNKITQTKINEYQAIWRVLLPESIYRCFNELDPNSEEIMLENQNIYLAQDRILCMGIHKNGKKMHYLPDAYAEVDPIKNVHSFMGQRRRWINGSMFAFNKVKTQLKDNSQQNCEACLQFQMLYLSFLNALSYFSPSIFLFTVHLAMQAFKNDILPSFLNTLTDDPNSSFYDFFACTIDFTYVMLLGSILFLSLNLSHNQPKFKPYIYAISTIFGLFQLGVFTLFAFDLIRSAFSNQSTLLQNNAQKKNELFWGQEIQRWFGILLIISITASGLSILIYTIFFKRIRVLFDIMIGMLSCIFYSPTYLIILNVFALCRIDDISWGTKGLNKQDNTKSQNLINSWKALKYIQVCKFLFWNMVVGTIIVSFGQSYVPRFFISLILLVILLFSLLIKIAIGSFYLIKYACTKVITLEQNHIVPSTILEQVRVLKENIWSEVQKNFMKIKAEEDHKNSVNNDDESKKQTRKLLLSQIVNRFASGKSNFFKKLANVRKNKVQIKRQPGIDNTPLNSIRQEQSRSGISEYIEHSQLSQNSSQLYINGEQKLVLGTQQSLSIEYRHLKTFRSQKKSQLTRLNTSRKTVNKKT